jgi:4-amino-4-deoxy-L-arabinose transferase-like glycosyltransferase
MLEKRIKQITLVLLVLAALLRVIVYVQNRDLFLDEANLSRNIVEKSYGALFGALDYEQFAPPMYAVVVKFIVSLFSVQEYSLRLFALLMGLASLYLFYKLAKKMCTNVGLLYGVALFGFLLILVRYQTENKQYSGDVFFTLLFLLAVWHYPIRTIRQYALLGLAGGIAIWFSMPLIFSLVAIGLYLFYEHWIKGSSGQSRAYISLGLGLTALMWLSSFALLYVLNLKTSLSNTYLQDFHKYHYLKIPTSWSNVKHSYGVWSGFLGNMVGPLYLVKKWAELCIVLGIWQLFKRVKGKALLILIPIAACLVAAMLGKFVLVARVSLFMMPLFFLLMAVGVEFLFGKVMLWKNPVRYAAFAGMLTLVVLSSVADSAIPYFVKPYEVTASRTILRQLSEHPENHLPLFVIHIAKPTYLFYTQLYEPPIHIPSSSVELGVWNSDLNKLAIEWKQKGIEKIWIYDSHTFGKAKEKLKTAIQSIGETEVRFDGIYGNAYLVRLQ